VTGGKHPKRGWNRVRSISSTSTHTHESCHTYELSHVTQMNASHIRTSHVTHTPKSHGTISSYATGGKHMEAWREYSSRHLQRATHIHESCHEYELSHVTHMNASRIRTSHVTRTPKSHGIHLIYLTGGKHAETWLE